MDFESRTIDPAVYPEVAYFARRTNEGGAEIVYKMMWPDGHPEELKPDASQKLIEHSSAGFRWGCPGKGPAQLALALLLDATTDLEKAKRFHQAFKVRFVANWDDNWAITRSAILRWVESMERQTLKERINQNIN